MTSSSSGAIVPTIRVLCVDDSRDIATVLRQCIDREPDMECVGTPNSADDLVNQVNERRPDVMLLDVTMPGWNPLAVLRQLGAAEAHGRRGVRVIVFSGHNDQEIMDRAAEAGACGFLSKDAEVPLILRAIRETAERADDNTSFGTWR